MTYVIADILFVAAGGLLIIFALTTKTHLTETPTIDNVAKDLLLNTCPLNAAIGNAVLIFITFLASIPGMVLPTTRGWLKFQGFLVVVCGLFTMIIGLTIWFDTLKTRKNNADIWGNLPTTTQSLLQEKFNCCGYANSTSPPFAVDATCPDAAQAALQLGCVGPFATFANNFLDLIFTGAFGIVGIDVGLILAIAILLKDRKEKARYQFIDEKNGERAF